MGMGTETVVTKMVMLFGSAYVRVVVAVFGGMAEIVGVEGDGVVHVKVDIDGVGIW